MAKVKVTPKRMRLVLDWANGKAGTGDVQRAIRRKYQADAYPFIAKAFRQAVRSGLLVESEAMREASDRIGKMVVQ